MISAHGVPNSPAGNCFGIVPGITTARAGTRPRVITGFAAGHVDDRRRRGEHDAGAEHRPLLDQHALDHDRARADEAVVLDDHRPALRRLEHAADPDAAREVHALADLRARADRRPGVDHRALADARADVHVARHQDHAGLEERAVARDARRHDAHAGGREAALERDLVVELERARPRSCSRPRMRK